MFSDGSKNEDKAVAAYHSISIYGSKIFCSGSILINGLLTLVIHYFERNSKLAQNKVIIIIIMKRKKKLKLNKKNKNLKNNEIKIDLKDNEQELPHSIKRYLMPITDTSD